MRTGAPTFVIHDKTNAKLCKKYSKRKIFEKTNNNKMLAYLRW